MTTFAELRGSRELLAELTLRDVRGKYKRTLLGHVWSLLNPLATMLIYTLVFGLFLRIQPSPGDPSGIDVFALWLTCALLPWNFLANTMSSGMSALVGNANLVQKVYFPREVLVTSVVLSWDVTFLTEMAVLSAALLLFGAFVIPWLPLVLFFMTLLTVFALGLALLLAVANVYFRDTQHFMGILLQLWFYLTPIVYPIDYIRQVGERLAAQGVDIPVEFLFRLNPMERFVSVFRSLLYDNRLPALSDAAYCVGAAVVSLTIGYLVFRRYAGRIAEEL